MDIVRKLKPGQPGTKKLVQEYGEKLLCVRYRYDTENKQRTKSIELVIERVPWEPSSKQISPEVVVQIRVAYGEVDLGRRVRTAGGEWNRQKKVWELPYREVLRLELADRIIGS